MSVALSIIIPTKNRADEVAMLLASIGRLDDLARLRPEIIVSDNNANDDTWARVSALAQSFPIAIQTVKARKPGKSAAINEALRVAKGDILALLDDDVVVDSRWLTAVERFCGEGNYQVAQGRILLQPPEGDDPSIQKLMHRYRTIPYLNFGAEIKEVHSLDGANFIIGRELLTNLGGFDEKLGPGASGTSEDVELSRRILQSGYRIGYMLEATVFHNVDRHRLTEKYFESKHRQQGHSRLLLKPRGTAHILFNLCWASVQYAVYSLTGQERKRYRNKGRMHHYWGMLEAKWTKPTGE
jgi:GT2 family glycosyltransferase